MRQPSKHIVVIFDPNKDTSLPQVLASEQAKNPKVSAVFAQGELGLVQTPKGAFYMDHDGVGPDKPVESIPVDFYRRFEDGSEETIPFATARFSVAEALSLKIAEKPLHEFIRTFGARLEYNYEAWEKALATT